MTDTHDDGSRQSDAETAKREAVKAKDQAAAAAKSVADDARDTAARAAKDARDGVAQEVNSVARAFRAASDELRDGSPQERGFSQLAGMLADTSDSIASKDLSEMSEDITGFARSNPLAFLGGAAALGFVAARFAKASRPADTYGSDYDDDIDDLDDAFAATSPAVMTDLRGAPPRSAAPADAGLARAERTTGTADPMRKGGSTL